MSSFKIVNSPSQIHLGLDEEWDHSIEKFQKGSVPTYLNDKGKKVTATYTGHKYELISIKERQLSGTEKFGRKFLFVLAMVFTLGIAYFSKSVYKLYKKETATLKIALYPKKSIKLSPKEDFQSKATSAIEKNPKSEKPKQTPPKVVLPPLPKLKSIVFDPANEWMKSISRDLFIRPEKLKEYVAAKMFGASLEDLDAIGLYSSILELSLENWLSPQKLLPHQKEELNNPQFKAGVESIQKRIKDLNDSIQLEERFKRIKFITCLKVKDLLVSWDKSPLKVSLMMEDELAELKVSDLKECSVEDPMVVYRLGVIEKKQEDHFDQTTLSSANIQEILLTNLCKLKAATLNQFTKDLPLLAFSSIATSEIPKVKVEALSPNQLKALLCSEERVKILSISQVNACVDKMEYEIAHLTPEQILKLDFSKINKKRFDALFNPHSYETKILFQKYPLARIYEISQYFEAHHWELLSKEQIFNLDFSKIDKTIFNAIFRSEKLLQKYPLARIYEICQYFTDKHWKMLSDEQILNFDYSKIDEKIFKLFFDPYNYTRTPQLLKKISDSQLIALKTYLGKDLHRHLSHKQKELLL